MSTPIPTPEDIALADSIVRRIANHRECGHSMFEMDISCRHADLPAAHYTALLIAAHTAPLRELAEIGRLAVEQEKAWRHLASDPAIEVLRGDELGKSMSAYLAKHPTNPTT